MRFAIQIGIMDAALQLSRLRPHCRDDPCLKAFEAEYRFTRGWRAAEDLLDFVPPVTGTSRAGAENVEHLTALPPTS